MSGFNASMLWLYDYKTAMVGSIISKYQQAASLTYHWLLKCLSLYYASIIIRVQIIVFYHTPTQKANKAPVMCRKIKTFYTPCPCIIDCSVSGEIQ